MVRSQTPGLFAVASGFQWAFLGVTYNGKKSFSPLISVAEHCIQERKRNLRTAIWQLAFISQPKARSLDN